MPTIRHNGQGHVPVPTEAIGRFGIEATARKGVRAWRPTKQNGDLMGIRSRDSSHGMFIEYE